MPQNLADARRPAKQRGQPFISPDLSATGTINKSGYDITYRGGRHSAGGSGNLLDGHGDLRRATMRSRIPTTANVTGVRTFGTNEGAALFEDP